MDTNAEIIAAGSELLTPERLDTNSLTITHELNKLGVEVVAKHVIGDDRERLTDAVKSARARSGIVILCGGLGPTEDDVTRDAAAAALARPLIYRPELEEQLRARFRHFNRPMAPNNLRQTYLIEGADALPNPNGSAPGQFFRDGDRVLVLLPGPPREMKPMFENEVLPRLKPLLPKRIIKVRSFRITGMGESDLDALIAPVYTRYTNPVTTVLFSPGDLAVHLRAHGDDEAEVDALLKEVGDPISELLGERIFTECADETLDEVVGNLLRRHKATVATGESCTGGLLAYRLTEQPGSSDYFLGGFVTYSEAEKQSVLGVPAELIAQYTAVSKPVAAAMAEGARRRTGATYALSITGYAGPGGGTEEAPVGTVFIGLAGPGETKVIHTRHSIGRSRIRTLAAQAALDLLRRTIRNFEESGPRSTPAEVRM
jgi:nicotinamide-nucleotide amidase